MGRDPRDRTGLSWSGAGRPPSNGGGFVSSVGLNGPVAPPLAFDFERPRPTPPPPPSATPGPQLSIEPLSPPAPSDAEARVRPSGRIRMPSR